MARPGAASSNRTKIIIAVVGAVGLVAIVAGVLGFTMRGHSPSSTAQRPASASSAQHGSSAPSSTPASGSVKVAVAPGVAGNPDASAVTNMLTRYFAAINTHDFSSYQALLDARMRRTVTLAIFNQGYASTSDSAATLTGISTAHDGRTTANVTFTSHQNPAAGPDHSSCTNWSITLFLDRSGGGYLIGPAEPGYHASHRTC